MTVELDARQQNEAAVYNARAKDVLASVSDDELVVDAEHPPYPNREHVEFLDFVFDRIGSLTGTRVLEVGCGSGTLSSYLALNGAQATGVDVSSGMLELARRRAEVNGVSDRVELVASPVETLDLPDGSFDAVIANQVLHHLDLPRAMPNIRRLLAPGGCALFVEPVLFVPEWVRTARYSKPVTKFFPSRADTPDERSLDQTDIANIRAHFASSEVYEFQLLSRMQNFVHLSDSWFSRLERTDRVLLSRVPPARRLCRYVVIVLNASPASTQKEEAVA